MDRAPEHLDLERGDAYGRSFGDVYDRWYDGVTDAKATADFVLTRHPGGLVLELGVGTGRLARPLADRGLTVVGLDASLDMLDRCPRLPEQTGPGRIRPVLADMRALPFGGDRTTGTPFGSALIAFNTLFNLARMSDQTRLLADLAGLVDRRGVVVIEMLDVSALLEGPDRSIGRRGPPDPDDEAIVITATQLDRPNQRLSGQHLEVSATGVAVRPWMLRWVTPTQLDDMAERAGLRFVERHGSWHGAPSTGGDTTVISVYRPARSRPV